MIKAPQKHPGPFVTVLFGKASPPEKLPIRITGVNRLHGGPGDDDHQYLTISCGHVIEVSTFTHYDIERPIDECFLCHLQIAIPDVDEPEKRWIATAHLIKESKLPVPNYFRMLALKTVQRHPQP